MSDIPGDLKFLSSHEWARVNDDGTVTIGISDHAQSQLGDIVYVELPEIGDDVIQGDEFGSVESVKSLSSLFSPISGEVLSVNSDLVDQPSTLNDSPYEDGWLIRVNFSDHSEIDDLMTAEEYKVFKESL